MGARTHDQTGENNPNWKGGQTKSKKGYVYVMRPDHPRAMKSGYVKRADLVLEAVIGRPLQRGEEAHHKNHVRDDDSPDNLELHTKESHSRLHGDERRKPKPVQLSKRRGAAPSEPARPAKRIAWPPTDELTARVTASSLRIVAKEIGCSHVALYFRVHPEKKP